MDEDVQLIGPDPVAEPYADVWAGSISGIQEEITAVMEDLKRWGGDKPALVRAGELEDIDGEFFVYRLEIEPAVRAPEYTALVVVEGMKEFHGFVNTTEEDGRILIVSLEEQLPPQIPGLAVSFDATFVLREMLERFDTMRPEVDFTGREAVERSLGLRPCTIKRLPAVHDSIARRGLNEDQVALISQILGSDFSLGFGPPGTGKTKTAGSAVAELAQLLDLRVLVTAHTHVALDTLLASVLDALPSDWASDGRIVRSGKHHRDFKYLGISTAEVTRRKASAIGSTIGQELAAVEAEAALLLPETYASRALLRARSAKAKKARTTVDIEARLIALLGRARQLPPSLMENPHVLVLVERIEKLRQEVQSFAGTAVANARIVGATLSKLATAPNEFGRFDVVLIDELSMAQLPLTMIAATFSDGAVVGVGDPRQLPPIVSADTGFAERYLKANLYTHLGLDDPTIEDPRCPLLRIQYRMDPTIRSFVSDTWYGGKLIDAPSVTERAAPERSALILVDTSASGARAAKRGTSWVNPVHAEMISDLVRQVHEHGTIDIGIVTPFNAQAKLIREVLRDSVPDFFRAGGTVGTVHRSQGREKDVIILDITDTPPSWSWFLDERKNSDVSNLLCVATSRARNRLIILAHAPGLRERYGPSNGLIMRMLRTAYRTGSYVRPEPAVTPANGQRVRV